MQYKKRLLAEVWEKSEYAQTSDSEFEKSFDDNPALVRLLGFSKSASKILDCGCGDGRIISKLYRKDAKWWGIDLSTRAIASAKKRFIKKKNVQFDVGDLEKLPYKTSSFDFVYCVYVLEHTEESEKILSEMMRVLAPGGMLAIVAPNFGSPLEPSGNVLLNGQSLKARALVNLVKSFKYLIFKPKNLNWDFVYPKVLDTGKWESDFDATREPYIQTLVIYLGKKGFEVLESNSGFLLSSNFEKAFVKNPARTLLEFLGKMGIVPFKYFGPTIFVVAKK